MSASSHFMIPISVAAARPQVERPRTQAEAAAPSGPDHLELDAARRRAALLSLLAIYAIGLGLVVLLYEGEDIGVVLSAFLAHALYMAARGIASAFRSTSVNTRVGTLVIHDRARLVPIALRIR